MRLFFAGALLTIAGLAGWAVWRRMDNGAREGAGPERKGARVVTARERMVIPEALKDGPLPRPKTAEEKPAVDERTLIERARELAKMRKESPRGQARARAARGISRGEGASRAFERDSGHLSEKGGRS